MMSQTRPIWRRPIPCGGIIAARVLGLCFHKPKILGQSYQLISEQLLRDKHLSISTGTMATLTEGIDERLRDSRALIAYVAGILIFLGLIGTFVGLMVTLASVGDILGALDLTGADPSETVAALMANLRTPLGGMATGFSSSLFGLVTSLTLSIMLQLIGRGGRSLKADFSDWLSNAVELHEGADAKDAPGSVATSARMEERRLSLLMRTARHSIQSSGRTARALEQLVEQVRVLGTQTQRNERALSTVGESIRLLSKQNEVVHHALCRSVDAYQAMARGTQLRSEVAELASLAHEQRAIADDRVLDRLQQIDDRVTALSIPVPTSPDREQDEGEEIAAALKSEAAQLTVSDIKRVLAAAYKAQKKASPRGDEDTVVDNTPPQKAQQT